MSSTLLDVHQLALRFGERTLLAGFDLRVAAGDRVALIGENGTGKSTLLRALAGRRAVDGGRIVRHGSQLMLDQLGRRDERELTVRQAAASALGVTQAAATLHQAEQRLAAGGDLSAAIADHGSALERWIAAGGPEIEALLGAGAERVGLPAALLDRPLSTLSSGQAMRAGLLALASKPPELLLLDEPTNHLDADGRARLHELLDEHRGAIVLASHDRRLLARFAERIVELAPRAEPARHFAGGWDAYEHERRIAEERAHRDYDEATARRDALREAEREIRRRAAATRNRLARPGRDGDKLQKEWFRARADGVAARGRTVGARADAVAIPDRPWQAEPLALQLTAQEEHADVVVALDRVRLRRGDWHSPELSLAVAPGERILLSGANGAGKSTLLEALAGTLTPESGTRVCGPRAVVCVLGAVERALAGTRSLAETARQLTGLEDAAVRQRLAQAGLGPQAAGRPAATLSPGERTRAELAVIGALRTTCLLLDEPSNHLDLRALEALEQALAGWPGALVVATHDEAFAERLGASREVTLGAAVSG